VAITVAVTSTTGIFPPFSNLPSVFTTALKFRMRRCVLCGTFCFGNERTCSWLCLHPETARHVQSVCTRACDERRLRNWSPFILFALQRQLAPQVLLCRKTCRRNCFCVVTASCGILHWFCQQSPVLSAVVYTRDITPVKGIQSRGSE